MGILTDNRRIQGLSIDILKQIIAAAKCSGNLISKLAETTDFGNDAQFMVFARCCATMDYVEQSLLCSPLDKRITRKEMLKKVESFTK